MNRGKAVASLVFLLGIGAVVTVVDARSLRATSVLAPADPVRLQQAYKDHLAANAAAQTAARQGSSAAAQTSAVSCAPGFVYWLRDSMTPLCEPACTSDADCGPDDGRCRLLDVDDKSPAPPTLLVDDMAPEDVDAMLNDPTKMPPPVRVCDPFWDVVGATDAVAPASTP